jgi:DNA-binding transcriptional ArsR family regulator
VKAGKSMQELSECPQLRRFLDPQLVKALGHPVREHILAVFNERVASAREIGEELGADVSSFYHHVEELERLGFIERIETRQRRGAKEHFFQAKRTVFFDDRAWQQLPALLRADLATSFVQLLFEEAALALEAGTFDRRGDEHVSWMPGRFDAQGWKEATGLMDQTLECLSAIQSESSARLAKAGKPGMPATLGILAFETPEPG